MLCAATGWARQILGRRGAFLLLAGAGKMCLGAGLIAATPADLGIGLAADVAPLAGWAWLWIAAGAVTAGSAFLRVGRDGLGFVAALVPPSVWAVAYTVAAVRGEYDRGGWIAGWFLASHIGVILWASAVPEHSLPSASRCAREGKAP